MPVRAQDARAVRVVEQHELVDQLVLIRSDLLAKDAQVGTASSLLQRTKDLVIRAILLDDVHDVFDQARFADPFRDGPRGLVGTGGQSGLSNRAPADVLCGSLGQLLQIVRAGNRHQGHRSVVMMRIESLGVPLLLGLDGQALDVGHTQGVSAGIEQYGTREPAGRNQSLELGVSLVFGVKVHDADGVLSSVGDEQSLSRGVEGEGIGRRSEQIGRLALDPHVFDHGLRRHVDDAQVVATRIRADDILLIGRNRQCRRMQAGQDLTRDFVLLLDFVLDQVNHADGTFAGDVSNWIDSDTGATSGGPGEIARGGPSASPVTDERLVSHERDVIRGDAHVKRLQHGPCGSLDLEQSVREIAAHIELRVIGRQCQSTGDLGFAAGCRRIGQRDGM